MIDIKTSHTLNELFQQLGLPSEHDSIEAFIKAHPLPEEMGLIDAPWWSASQKDFLKAAFDEDAQWIVLIDQLRQRLAACYGDQCPY